MRLLLLVLAFFLSACGDSSPLPSENRQELVILTRIGVTTYQPEGLHEAGGFDYDLAQKFADELGLKARFVVAASDADILRRLRNNEAQLGAAWLTPPDEPRLRGSMPYFQSHNVLVTHEASLPVTDIRQLSGKTVHVLAGSRQEAAIRALARDIPEITIVTKSRRSELDLMEGVANRSYEAALVNNAVFNIGNNYYPELQGGLRVGTEKAIVWLFSPSVSPELIGKANAFLQRVRQNGEMDRLRDRYFGHVERLTPTDSAHFIERMNSVLPKYIGLFKMAQNRTGIDWRLLAALSYQESQWDPLATSPTGVRGMMMLTEDTADQLGVSNRLDPEQSIRAGAQYLGALRDTLPRSIREPDRLWMALAAYNLGMGHLNAARYIARTKSANPDSWYDMKKVLPLLSKPQYYNHLKAGRGRGGEAVIMTENIRVYSDILRRHERSHKWLGKIADTLGGKAIHAAR